MNLELQRVKGNSIKLVTNYSLNTQTQLLYLRNGNALQFTGFTARKLQDNITNIISLIFSHLAHK